MEEFISRPIVDSPLVDVDAARCKITRDRAKADNDRRYREGCKKRLLNTIEKKFKTTIIGAIASVEAGFGELWGHGKPEVELTEDERNFRAIWQEVRTEILNKGNNNLRGAQDEIAQYSTTWEGFRTEFIVK